MKYKELLIFILVTLMVAIIGIFFHFEKSNIWSFFEVIDTSTAVALSVLAFLAYKEYIKEEDEIELKIAIYQKDRYDKPIKIIDFSEIAGNKIKILRKEVSRGEILGLLGMFQKDTGKRYTLSDNVLILLLLDELKKIQKGDKNECIIPILKKDYELHFKL